MASGCCDDDRVTVETFSAELNLAQPQEIELYAGVLTSWPPLPATAGQRAAIITRVIDDLAAEAAREDGGVISSGSILTH